MPVLPTVALFTDSMSILSLVKNTKFELMSGKDYRRTDKRTEQLLTAPNYLNNWKEREKY